VKGQEFPVVVIEGVPKTFSWALASQIYANDLPQARIEMWQARRLVYLAASRTNVFLYFILPPDTPADVAGEFQSMFSQLGQHPEQVSPAGTLWELRVSKLGDVERLDDYLDAIEAESVGSESTTLPPIQPTSELKVVVSGVESQPTISSWDSESSSTKHELAKPASLAVITPDTNSTTVPQFEENSINITSASGSSRPAAPPKPHPVAPKPGIVRISDLSDELRRPVKVIINILERNGYKGLASNSEVNREIALRIFRRINGDSAMPQSSSAAFNTLAEQLDGKMQKTAGVRNDPKINHSIS
jgi:hypothetical protein